MLLTKIGICILKKAIYKNLILTLIFENQNFSTTNRGKATDLQPQKPTDRSVFVVVKNVCPIDLKHQKL
jgi:hypothetical protein